MLRENQAFQKQEQNAMRHLVKTTVQLYQGTYKYREGKEERSKACMEGRVTWKKREVKSGKAKMISEFAVFYSNVRSYTHGVLPAGLLEHEQNKDNHRHW